MFMGNAPLVGLSSFYSVASGCIASISSKSTGWGVGAGEKWNELILQYWPAILTEVTSDAEVREIVATFADEELAAHVSTVAEYDAFKTWAGSVKGAGSAGGAVAGEAAVVANTNAAAAYLLGAERLFENKPKVEFGEMVVVENGTQGTGGTDGTGTAISVAVTVRDGEEAVKCAEEKVKDMFEATSDLGDWNGAAKMLPTVTVEESEGATMRFKVTPGDGTAPQAFLRIRK